MKCKRVKDPLLKQITNVTKTIYTTLSLNPYMYI